MTIHLCIIDYDTLDDRGDCPNALHDWPLPDDYVAAEEVAMSRISQGWREQRCPDCGLVGWTDPPKPMRGKAKNPVRVPAGTRVGVTNTKERTMTEKTIDKSKTVTIDRDTYNILVAAYKAFEAAERASWARSAVPMLTPNELESLDQA